MNPPTQAGAAPKPARASPRRATGSRRRRGAAAPGRVLDRRHRRPRLRRARGDGRGGRDGATRPARPPSASCSPPARSPRTSSRARSRSASASTTSTCRLYRVDPDAAKLVTPAAIKRYQAVPVSFASDRTLLVAMADPANVLAVDDIAVMTGYEVRPAVASPADIDYVLERLGDPSWGGGDGAAPELEPIDDERPEPRPPAAATGRSTTSRRRRSTSARRGEDASVIQLVQRVIAEAVERGASDIHFEPQEEEMRVRYRIDGVLQEAAIVPASRRSRRSPRASRSSPTSTSPSAASRRTAASRPRSTGKRDRPPRRDAARAVRRERRHAHPGLVEGDDQHGAARHAAAGARALHQGLQPVPRRRARDRPDRLGQVDVALRRAQPAQHGREEHHHDRGPGRVPARGPHPGAGQQEGRA